ncbi:MAG TPA: hypothetical protein V6D10_24130 [Trichocoleus sp.]|jgi:hypothetical protein
MIKLATAMDSRQPSLKAHPWLATLILFTAYTSFSWFLSHATTTLFVWVIVITFTLLQALLLTTLFDGLRRFMQRWLRSDLGYFTLIILGAMSVTIALVWFRIFGYFLVLIAAEVLARLELQNVGFNRVQALAILTVVSFAGLAMGWLISFIHVFRFSFG